MGWGALPSNGLLGICNWSRLLEVGLFFEESGELIYSARGASAWSKTHAKARAKAGMDERDLGRDEKLLEILREIFSEPVAPATGEVDWLIGNCLRNFRGKHSCISKKRQRIR